MDVPPCCLAVSAPFLSAQTELGRQWNTQNLSLPNPVLRRDETPCTFILKNVQAVAGDYKKRTPKLFRIAQILGRIAHEYGIAVVLTNQVGIAILINIRKHMEIE